MITIFETLRLLTPFDIDRPKARIGPNTDGGYILVGDLLAQQPVLSFGVGEEARFDLDLARRGHKVFLFDHSISAPPLQHENFVFVKEGLAGAGADGASFRTLEEHISRLNLQSNELILKIDTEGAEWDALARTSFEVLSRVQQIVIEVHDVVSIRNPDFREIVWSVLSRLNREFTLFHVHANNYASLEVIDGFPVFPVLELSYVRTACVKPSQSATLYPTTLDHANRPSQPDHLLWVFPFMPHRLTELQLIEAASRVDERFELNQAKARLRRARAESDRVRLDAAALREEYERLRSETKGMRAVKTPSAS